MPLSTIAALRRRMPQLRLYDAYGLTETHSPATILLDSEFRRKPGSVGRPLPCAEVRVVDDDGHDVPAGDVGELWIRGPMVTPGYFGDAAATDAAITDGWLHSGDYARVDDEGYVFILDRKKDMIMRGGNKVYSVELEYLLVSHPDIAEAAVFGVPDRLAYESVAAYVVPATGRSVDVGRRPEWVGGRMADYAVPRHVRVVDVIPRNRTGKIDKNGPEGDHGTRVGGTTMSDDRRSTWSSRVRNVAATHLDLDPGRLLPGARLGEDLCVDSLDAIELTMVLEDEFDIALPDRLVADVRTYGDVVTLVRTQVQARGGAAGA